MRPLHIRDIVKLVYDDVEIIFKGPGAFNKLDAYRIELDKEDIYYEVYWKVGPLGIKWSQMHTINMLKPRLKGRRIKSTVDHQGIAGGIFLKERELTVDEIDKSAMAGNIACLNFSLRREDFLPDFNKKCYYGKVVKKSSKPNDPLLGYVICEDELEEGEVYV